MPFSIHHCLDAYIVLSCIPMLVEKKGTPSLPKFLCEEKLREKKNSVPQLRTRHSQLPYPVCEIPPTPPLPFCCPCCNVICKSDVTVMPRVRSQKRPPASIQTQESISIAPFAFPLLVPLPLPLLFPFCLPPPKPLVSLWHPGQLCNTS